MIVSNSPFGVVYIRPIQPPISALFEGVAPDAILPIPSSGPLGYVALYAGKRRIGRKRFEVDHDRALVAVADPPANGKVMVVWAPRPRWRLLGPVRHFSMETSHG